MQLSKVSERLLALERVDFISTRRSSDFTLLGWRKFEVNKILISARHCVRKVGGRSRVFKICRDIRVKMWEEGDNEEKGSQDKALGHT